MVGHLALESARRAKNLLLIDSQEDFCRLRARLQIFHR